MVILPFLFSFSTRDALIEAFLFYYAVTARGMSPTPLISKIPGGSSAVLYIKRPLCTPRRSRTGAGKTRVSYHLKVRVGNSPSLGQSNVGLNRPNAPVHAVPTLLPLFDIKVSPSFLFALFLPFVLLAIKR